jgi:hypothetical protein
LKIPAAQVWRAYFTEQLYLGATSKAGDSKSEEWPMPIVPEEIKHLTLLGRYYESI